jgi:ubiquitin-activating enzyme E1
MFNENYNISIIKLLESFPSDHLINDNIPFWSNGKKCPKPIILDITNKEHQEFIDVTSELLYICFGSSNNIYFPQDFDPENDLHIRWIMSASNMRANNYLIPTIDKYQTKEIVSKNIPTIPITCSIISGLVSLEILKYLVGFEHNEYYKSCFINLTKPIITYSNPKPAQMIEIGGVLVNSWTKFEYNNDSTLNEFKNYYEKVFDTLIIMIVIESTMIYAEFLDSDVLDKKLSSVLLEHFNTSNIPENVSFNLLSNDEKEIPIITVNLIIL